MDPVIPSLSFHIPISWLAPIQLALWILLLHLTVLGRSLSCQLQWVNANSSCILAFILGLLLALDMLSVKLVK
jgi:fructose-specific phosphotransferase system IIC component